MLLGDEKNGNNGQPEEVAKDVGVTEPVKEEAKPEEKASGEPQNFFNTSKIEDGVMTVTLYLEKHDNDFAAAVGSLDLAKDQVKQYFANKALAEAAIRARYTQKIIRATGDIK